MGAFALKRCLKEVADLFDYVLIDVQPSRSQVSLTAAGASDYVLVPVERNVKGVNSLVETLAFLDEEADIASIFRSSARSSSLP